MKVDEFFHLRYPHISRKEPIKEIPLEDLPIHWTTTVCLNIPPLHVPLYKVSMKVYHKI